MIGLGDTLSLLKAGYKKKDIDALIAMDEEEKKKADSDSSKVGEVHPAPDSSAQGKQEDTPDYKKMYEEMKASKEKIEKVLTDIQQKNIRGDISGDAQKQKEEAASSLLDSIKSFM